MSQANVAIVRRLQEHFIATSELPEELFAPAFVWDMSTFRDWPEQKFYEGAQGLGAFLGDWTSVFSGWELKIDAYHDAGEKVVVVGVQYGRSDLGGGLPLEAWFGLIYTVHDDLLTRGEAYADPAEALKAVGLAE